MPNLRSNLGCVTLGCDYENVCLDVFPLNFCSENVCGELPQPRMEQWTHNDPRRPAPYTRGESSYNCCIIYSLLRWKALMRIYSSKKGFGLDHCVSWFDGTVKFK